MSNGEVTLWARMPPNLREKHSQATRRALIRSARKLFARRGYEATGVDQIAAHAGATRGAFYHHFEGKRELLITVLDEMLEALARRIVEAAAPEADPWLRLNTALATFLDASTEPANARIVLKEAPAALGWDAWREVDGRHFMALTQGAIRDLIAKGYLPMVDPEILAHLLMAALTEAALLIVRDNTPDTRAKVDATVDALVGGLAQRNDAPRL